VGGLAGVLIGLGALVIPGIGPVIAAGPLATVLAGLAGAGAGAVAGGVLGALVDLGIPEETAGYYAEGVRRGGTLVSVRVEDQYTDKALDILNRHNPVDLDERSQQWRREGWTGYRDDIADTTQGAERRDPMDTHYDTARTGQEHTRFDDTGVTHQDYDRSRQDVTDRDYRQYDETFRSDFQNRPFSRDFTYEQYEPAYRYGYDLRMDESLPGSELGRNRARSSPAVGRAAGRDLGPVSRRNPLQLGKYWRLLALRRPLPDPF
jgi:hypothetical protein